LRLYIMRDKIVKVHASCAVTLFVGQIVAQIIEGVKPRDLRLRFSGPVRLRAEGTTSRATPTTARANPQPSAREGGACWGGV